MIPLSVIMPVYNQERYVSQAIQSVLAQTYTDFEFVIVDDGSSDKTVEIVRSFRDGRIRLIRADHRGFIEALKTATREAKGRWLARMDSDDVCAANRFATQLGFLHAHSDVVLLTCYYGIITTYGRRLAPPPSESWHTLAPRDITLATRPFCDPGAIYRRDIALEVGYDDEWPWEKPLWYRLLQRGAGAILEEPLYFVRWRIGSVSRGQNKYPSHMATSIRLKYDRDNALELPAKPQKRVAIKAEKRCVQFSVAAGDFRAAREIAFKVWRRYPFSGDALKLIVSALGIRKSVQVTVPGNVQLRPVDSGDSLLS